jgi:hypothetical protein
MENVWHVRRFRLNARAPAIAHTYRQKVAKFDFVTEQKRLSIAKTLNKSRGSGRRLHFLDNERSKS